MWSILRLAPTIFIPSLLAAGVKGRLGELGEEHGYFSPIWVLIKSALAMQQHQVGSVKIENLSWQECEVRGDAFMNQEFLFPSSHIGYMMKKSFLYRVDYNILNQIGEEVPKIFHSFVYAYIPESYA